MRLGVERKRRVPEFVLAANPLPRSYACNRVFRQRNLPRALAVERRAVETKVEVQSIVADFPPLLRQIVYAVGEDMQEEWRGDVRRIAGLSRIREGSMLLVEVDVEFGAGVGLAGCGARVGRPVRLSVERERRVPQFALAANPLPRSYACNRVFRQRNLPRALAVEQSAIEAKVKVYGFVADVSPFPRQVVQAAGEDVQEERRGDVRRLAGLPRIRKGSLLLVEVDVEFGAGVGLAGCGARIGRPVCLRVERKRRVPESDSPFRFPRSDSGDWVLRQRNACNAFVFGRDALREENECEVFVAFLFAPFRQIIYALREDMQENSTWKIDVKVSVAARRLDVDQRCLSAIDVNGGGVVDGLGRGIFGNARQQGIQPGAAKPHRINRPVQERNFIVRRN